MFTASKSFDFSSRNASATGCAGRAERVQAVLDTPEQSVLRCLRPEILLKVSKLAERTGRKDRDRDH